MKSLFSVFPKENLCQLFIFPSIPNIDVCNSYYRITDNDVLKSFYRFHVRGTTIEPDVNFHQIFDDEKEAKNHCTDKNKKPIRGLLRDIMWRNSNWFNKGLRLWIEREKPTCIFLVPGNAKFIYNIALKISKEYSLPLVAYVCDEYYFVKKPRRFLARIKLNLLKRTVNRFMEKCSYIITICDELSSLYHKAFHIPATTIMTGSKFLQSREKIEILKQSPTCLNYFGNISINRNQSLADIGKVVDEINTEYKTNFKVNIYSPETNDLILSVFNGVSSINLKGYVGGEEYTYTFLHSDSLLHVEAFDEESIDRVKNSISTKIADSLGSGIPLFAYGPAEIASMGYLLRNNCAFCATSNKDLKNKLISLFFDEEKNKEIIENELKTASHFHDERKNSSYLYSILKDIEYKR